MLCKYYGEISYIIVHLAILRQLINYLLHQKARVTELHHFEEPQMAVSNYWSQCGNTEGAQNLLQLTFANLSSMEPSSKVFMTRYGGNDVCCSEIPTLLFSRESL